MTVTDTEIGPSHAEIREQVRKLCEQFPGSYWRTLDRAREYPAEFVRALTDAGYLAALIPQEYGGSGLPLSATLPLRTTLSAMIRLPRRDSFIAHLKYSG